MRPAVRAAWVTFTAPLEGVVPWMYQDVKGLVSTGIGNLIDPVSLAISLPFVRLDGTPATREDIVAEWMRIKNLPPDAKGRTAAMLGHLYAKPHTRLRLTPTGIEQVVQGKLNQNDVFLRHRFADFESWPCDAQLATHSMAWACGPAFRFPKLEAALRALDFRTAAVEAFMPEERTISGLRPRNVANDILYRNAAVAMHMLDPDVLYYPTDLDKPPVDKEADTLPELVPSRRPPRVEDMRIVHGPVPLGRPALDGDLPTTPPDDDEPPPNAA